MDTDSKLIPVLREGVSIIKMVLFKELKSHLSGKYPTETATDINRLSGAIINELFGTPQPEEAFVLFLKENRKRIDSELSVIGDVLPNLKIPLTDALRVQFLCDSLEGINSESILERAKEWGVLLVDRNIPFPKNFMNLSRKLGEKYHFLTPSDIKGDT